MPLGDADQMEADFGRRYKQWQQDRPKRDYVGRPLEETRQVLPREQSAQVAGQVYWADRGASSPRAVSGAPKTIADLINRGMMEVVLVPFFQEARSDEQIDGGG